MSKRSRRKKTRPEKPERSDAALAQGSRAIRLLAVALALLGAGAVALGVFATRGSRCVPAELPPLGFSDRDGLAKPVIDSASLARFARQHRLPTIPDLSRLSAEAARDIHGALQRVAARPDDPEALGHLGCVFHSHQYPAKALECYSQARSLAPAAFEWAYYVGRIHADSYRFGPAIEAYESAAQLNPSYASTFLALGNLYLQQGDSEKARKAYQRLVALRPQSSHGYIGLAQVARDEQEYTAAIELLGNAVSRAPQDFRAHNLLAQTYQQLGETEKARYHRAIVKSLDRRDELSKHLIFDDPLYHKMLASNTTDTALTERLRAAMGTNQPEVAIRLAEQLCRRHPRDAARLNSLATALKKAKRYSEALHCTERAISLDRDFVEAYLTRAQLLMVLRRNSEALELLDWVVTQDPSSFDGHYSRGAAQVLSGRYQSAVASFRLAVTLQPDSARAHVALAEALGETGRHAESIKEYRRALDLDPTNARARQRLVENGQ